MLMGGGDIWLVAVPTPMAGGEGMVISCACCCWGGDWQAFTWRAVAVGEACISSGVGGGGGGVGAGVGVGVRVRVGVTARGDMATTLANGIAGCTGAWLINPAEKLPAATGV